MKKNSNAKLEVENRRMEERLRVLREMMSAEKARREQDGGIYWQSGKSGPFKGPNKQPPAGSTPFKNPQNGRPLKVKVLSEKNGGKMFRDPLSQCGQCERTSASLHCVECTENYCQLCFTKIHQKGALSRHHVRPILQNVKRITPREVQKVEVGAPPKPQQECPNPSLLDGQYDEGSSAKSFQDALADWRSGKSKSSNHSSNTYSAKDSSTGTKFEASTMTGIEQTGAGSSTKRKIKITFSEKTGITYGEKLLMRKYQDGTMTSLPPTSMNGHTDQNQSEEDEEKADVISQYNIFYDIDTMPVEEVQGVKCEAISSDDDDFNDCKPPLRVPIEEVPFKTLGLADDKQKLVNDCGAMEGERPKLSSKEVKQHESMSCKEQQKARKLSANSKVQKPKAKGKVKKKNPSCSKSPIPTSQKSDIVPDLTESVQDAWKSCSQTPQPSLAQFFLQGVQPTEGEGIGNSQHNNSLEPYQSSKFTLGSTIWLPGSSTVQVQKPDSPSHDKTETTDMIPSSSRPSCSSRCRDLYYDDTDNDSEPENEREEFISSRLGMTRDSIEWRERATSATPCPAPEQEAEEEGKVERDQADCEALEDLAWELASTVECEGRLTRNKGDLELLDDEIERSYEVATPTGDVAGERSEDVVQEGEVEMSKVISDFELYQKSLMDADLD